ncbi:MAG: hypothetical protein AAFX04_00350 [Pseudomonadota bacterium]
MKQSEAIGLGIATIGHIALFGALSLGIASRGELRVPQESVAVILSDEVGLVDTSPTPNAEAATSMAPETGEVIPPEPEDIPQEVTEPTPMPETRPSTKPTRIARATPKPPPKPVDKRDRRRPDRRQRGSRFGENFLDGVTDKESLSREQNPPGKLAGPAVVASLQRELLRQVKPHWRPPTGADAEKLRTKITVALDRNGKIVGTPRIKTTGVTSSNRPQVKLHGERALAAVRLAAPFTFPPEYYDEWKEIEPVLYLGL